MALDGARYQATMKLGEHVEPVEYIENAIVYIDGIKQNASTYSLDGGVIKFKTTPAGIVTADYTYYWRVHFADDRQGIVACRNCPIRIELAGQRTHSSRRRTLAARFPFLTFRTFPRKMSQVRKFFQRHITTLLYWSRNFFPRHRRPVELLLCRRCALKIPESSERPLWICS